MNAKRLVESYLNNIELGMTVRQALQEAIEQPVIESVGGMDEDNKNKLESLMQDWIGESGHEGWVYSTVATNNHTNFVISVTKNPIAEFAEPVTFEINNDILNGETYHDASDVYLGASGPVTFAGMKSVLRDLKSQVEIADEDIKNAEASEEEETSSEEENTEDSQEVEGEE